MARKQTIITDEIFNKAIEEVITPQQSWGLDGKEQSQRLLNCCKIDLKIKTHRFR